MPVEEAYHGHTTKSLDRLEDNKITSRLECTKFKNVWIDKLQPRYDAGFVRLFIRIDLFADTVQQPQPRRHVIIL